MTAKELYETDVGFRGFIAVWVENKRCPFPLADYLLERDMPTQAGAAYWAATTPDRLVYMSKWYENSKCGPFPQDWGKSGHWAFFPSSVCDSAEDVPESHVPGLSDGDGSNRPTPELAILDLLDLWVVPYTPELGRQECLSN